MSDQDRIMKGQMKELIKSKKPLWVEIIAAIDALEPVEPKPVGEDAVSRGEVIKAVEDMLGFGWEKFDELGYVGTLVKDMGASSYVSRQMVLAKIRALSAVQPAPGPDYKNKYGRLIEAHQELLAKFHYEDMDTALNEYEARHTPGEKEEKEDD